jgi:hypothetical protein
MLELADRVAAGGADELKSVYAGLERAAETVEPSTVCPVQGEEMLRFVFPVLPPDELLALYYHAGAEGKGYDGAAAFTRLVQRGRFTIGPAFAARPEILSSLDAIAEGVGEDQHMFFRTQMACALIPAGPSGHRVLLSYPWGEDYLKWSSCSGGDPDGAKTENLIRSYSEMPMEEPWRRVDMLAKLVAMVPYQEAARDFLRAELPLNFVLQDHPEGPRALVYAAWAAEATDDGAFIGPLREAAGALRVKDPATMTSPAPRIEGGWPAALLNLAAKLDAAADRLAAVGR